MEIGLHVADFTYPNGPAGLADDLTRVVVAAEEAGFTRVSVMDHVWQIGVLGPPEHDMLEAYTTLGYIAARTERVELLAWVTAVSYREPGSGRDYDDIEKTVMFSLDAGDGGSGVDDLLTQLQALAKLGVQRRQRLSAEAHGWVPKVWETDRLALIGKEIIPAAAGM